MINRELTLDGFIKMLRSSTILKSNERISNWEQTINLLKESMDEAEECALGLSYLIFKEINKFFTEQEIYESYNTAKKVRPEHELMSTLTQINKTKQLEFLQDPEFRKCGNENCQNFFTFNEYMTRNRILEAEVDLMKLWNSPHIEFYCCECFEKYEINVIRIILRLFLFSIFIHF